MFFIIIISYRKVYTSVLWYWLDKEEHPCIEGGEGANGGVKPPSSFPHSQYICCKYIIEDRRKISSLIVFYKLFLSDIKVKILINS